MVGEQASLRSSTTHAYRYPLACHKCLIAANAGMNVRGIPVMAEIGYSLSSEEHDPNSLVQEARRAEEVGFTFALISDHFHPWVSHQGHSPFVWGVIGGISQATTRLQ